jgi:tRNA pseudouridine38-40 synthase
MRNIRLLLEYDGTNYVGWQKQKNGRSVQETLGCALFEILQEKVNVIGAGRTDAGVHARGQVANFRTETNLTLDEIRGGLNALLPDDIVVHQVEETTLEFHARFSAKERFYAYQITLKPVALLRNFCWYVKYPLDVGTMDRVVTTILGVHDFESFCRVNSDVEHHRCNVLSANWHSEDALLRFSISADRFLHGMVRTLVGTMVDVGRGYTTHDEFLSILEKRKRAEAGMAAPAKGLILEKIVY